MTNELQQLREDVPADATLDGDPAWGLPNTAEGWLVYHPSTGTFTTRFGMSEGPCTHETALLLLRAVKRGQRRAPTGCM